MPSFPSITAWLCVMIQIVRKWRGREKQIIDILLIDNKVGNQ